MSVECDALRILNVQVRAIEEVLQKHNQWIAEMQNRRKDHEHVPHDTLEDYKHARRNLLEFLSFAHSGDAEEQPAGLLDKIIDLVANYKNARTAQELVDKYK